MTKFITKPLHEQLRDALVARIASGEWKAGELLPNEKDLAKYYELSAGTVRRALQWMEDAKLVLREQGRGTFVADAADDEHRSKYDRLRMLDGRAVPRAMQILDVREAEASAEDCSRLRIAPASVVRRTTSIRRLEDEAFLFETVVVPVLMFPSEKLNRDAARDLISSAKLCGVMLGPSRERISVAVPPERIAADLGLSPGQAALRIDGTVFTLDGRPAQCREAYCNTRKCYYFAAAG